MSLLIGASTLFMPHDLPRALRIIREEGFAAAEICTPFLPPQRSLPHTDLRLSVHLPFLGLDLAHRDPEARELSVRTALRALELAARWGASLAVVHPGARLYEPYLSQHEPLRPFCLPREQYLRWSAEGLERLVRAATRWGLGLAVENMPPSRFMGTLGDQVDDLRWLLAEVPGLGFCLDVAHAHLSGGLEAWLGALGHRAVHLHLSDNRGTGDDHLGLGSGSVPWEDLPARLAALGFQGTVVLEVYSRAELVASRRLLERAASCRP